MSELKEEQKENLLRLLNSSRRCAKHRNFITALKALELINNYLKLYNLPVNSEESLNLSEHFSNLELSLYSGNFYNEAEKSRTLAENYKPSFRNVN
jgi:hypothetical protein